MTTEREADGGDAATTAGEEAEMEADDTSSMFDAEAEEAEAPPAAPDEVEQPDEAEATAAAPADGGGIDALTAAEIGLAVALGVLLGGSLVLAFSGRRR